MKDSTQKQCRFVIIHVKQIPNFGQNMIFVKFSIFSNICYILTLLNHVLLSEENMNAMIKKGSKLYSIAHITCPQCQEGKFLVSNVYNLKYVGDVRQECDVCHLKYEREPGFFYGAMYVSYAMMVAVFVTLWVLNTWFFHLDAFPFIFLVFLGSLGMMTLVFRGARLLWMNFFFRYDATLDKK